MFCIECGNSLPDVRDDSTICSKCKTPLATWWDESSQAFRTNRESILPSPYHISASDTDEHGRKMTVRRNTQTIEERHFQGALICLEGHFERLPGFGDKTMAETRAMVKSALDASLNKADVRETLAKNVDIWMRLNVIFKNAIPILTSRSIHQEMVDQPAPSSHDVPESATLILKNYAELVSDLHYLNSLLVISRNMLAIKETAQELCAAVGFDKTVNKLIVLCVSVTSKGYDGENVDESSRVKLNEVTELYKKLLVTSLQHTHNWTMGNDRFKMAFWYETLFDDDLHNDNIHELPPDDLNVAKVYCEVKNWLRRHSQKDGAAKELLDRYTADVSTGRTPGALPKEEEEEEHSPLREVSTAPVWKGDVTDKFEQDRLYARVSHEIDIWWKRVRDANYEGWVVPMETVEGAMDRAAMCKENSMHRYMPRGGESDRQYDQDYDEEPEDGHQDESDDRSTREDNGEEDEEDEEEDDDDSYAEGPLRGLLTEIPNILDTKQIEALHMTVKACIVDSMGSGLTPAGENLQKTRCKMFLALDCGKNLLRELLVFIAVWEQNDQQFIFQITAQIIESFHHNALLPYAWNSLRILKDIVSPAQTVLLRLINYMFRARKDSPIYDDLRDYNRDAKLIHFLYKYFRCRVVPDCIALIHAQEQIRLNKNHPSDFPVDLWDMERAKEGLSQYLDFITVIADIPEMRPLLVEWDAVYELVSVLRGLEQGVARKSIDERTMPGTSRPSPTNGNNLPPAPAPALQPLHDTPHRYPWAGIKIQILIILTSLVAPNNPRRLGPGNPTVQQQLVEHEGIQPLLNCLNYDGNHEYLKERATLCIKFVMEGCPAAQKLVTDLRPVKQAQAQTQAQAQLEAGRQIPGAAAMAEMNARAAAIAAENWTPTPLASQKMASGPILPPLPPNSNPTAKVSAPMVPTSNGVAASASNTEHRHLHHSVDDLHTASPRRKRETAIPAPNLAVRRASAVAKAKDKESAKLLAEKEKNQKLIMEKERELSAMIGSSRGGRTIELTDTASKIAAANRQVEEMRKFYERAGKDFDSKGGK